MTIDQSSAIISIAEYDELIAIRDNLEARRAEVEKKADKIFIRHKYPVEAWLCAKWQELFRLFKERN